MSKAADRRYNETHRAERKAYAARYRVEHAEELEKKRKLKWRLAHPIPSRGPLQHGTAAMYVAGCRCEECKSSHAAYNRLHRKQNPESLKAANATITTRYKSRTADQLLADQLRLRPDGKKSCRVCKERKNLDQFYQSRVSADGKGAECISCNRRKVLERSTRAVMSYWKEHGVAYGECYLCDSPAEQADHVLPLFLGGQDHPRNLMPACRSCNRSKWAIHPEAFFTARLSSLSPVERAKARIALDTLSHLF